MRYILFTHTGIELQNIATSINLKFCKYLRESSRTIVIMNPFFLCVKKTHSENDANCVPIESVTKGYDYFLRKCPFNILLQDRSEFVEKVKLTPFCMMLLYKITGAVIMFSSHGTIISFSYFDDKFAIFNIYEESHQYAILNN
jgi:hypothetical protein